MTFVDLAAELGGSLGAWRGMGSGSGTTTMPSNSRRSTARRSGTSFSPSFRRRSIIELDVYWAAVAGRDPIAEIRANADRVRLLHMKDRAPGPDARDAPAGEGTLPFPDIVDAARASGVEWYIVEQDDPREPLADIARALRYLESLAG